MILSGGKVTCNYLSCRSVAYIWTFVCLHALFEHLHTIWYLFFLKIPKCPFNHELPSTPTHSSQTASSCYTASSLNPWRNMRLLNTPQCSPGSGYLVQTIKPCKAEKNTACQRRDTKLKDTKTEMWDKWQDGLRLFLWIYHRNPLIIQRLGILTSRRRQISSSVLWVNTGFSVCTECVKVSFLFF